MPKKAKQPKIKLSVEPRHKLSAYGRKRMEEAGALTMRTTLLTSKGPGIGTIWNYQTNLPIVRRGRKYHATPGLYEVACVEVGTVVFTDHESLPPMPVETFIRFVESGNFVLVGMALSMSRTWTP